MKERRTEFQLDSKTVGALPLVNRFLDRLGFRRLMEKYLPPPDHRAELSPLKALEVLVRNLILCRLPLYGVGEWARTVAPELLGLAPQQVLLLNDDRIGRALDRLFDGDRSAFLTEFVVHMIREFRIDLSQFHNDSTTLTLHGKYRQADGSPIRGKATLLITFGHNKDHRPDLKQLLWILTVSQDGAVPVHFRVADGNTEDSTSHIATWEVLRALVGHGDFLYVADCKLCTRQNLRYIVERGGHFITVLPGTRKEDVQFKDWLKAHTAPWREIGRFPNPRQKDGPPEVIRALESPLPDSDGFRLIWYHSSLKQERDAEARQSALERALKGLAGLKAKLEGPRSRWSTYEGVAKGADQIIAEAGAGTWIRYAIDPWTQETFRQERRGRPGPATRWRRRTTARFRLSWNPDSAAINADARTDGVFPLLTDRRDLPVLAVLQAYKSKQPLVEKRHELLKNALRAVPAFLKSVARLEAFLLLHYVAVTVHALIEREIRAAMRADKIKQLPLYPEGKACPAPTMARIIEIFAPLQRHLLFDHAEHIQTFAPALTTLQTTVLRLLALTPETFQASWP